VQPETRAGLLQATCPSRTLGFAMEPKSLPVMFGGWLVFAVAAASPSDLRILVYDFAGTPRGAFAQAREDAARVFLQAGIRTRWVYCRRTADEAAAPDCALPRQPDVLELRLLPRVMTDRLRPLPTACGVAYLAAEDGAPLSAQVFCHRAQELAGRHQMDYGMILGHLMAHELGHLILGIGSHSRDGLMRTPWGKADLAAASRGALLFSPAEAARIRARLDPHRSASADGGRHAACRAPAGIVVETGIPAPGAGNANRAWRFSIEFSIRVCRS
jgi:hypothetical protein